MTARTTRRALQALGLGGLLFVAGVLVMFWATREEGPWILGIGPIRPPATITGEWHMAEWWADRIGLTLCFGALVFAAAFLAIARLGEKRPHMARCHECGYDLTGLTKPLCPECGHCVAPGALEPRRWKRDEAFWSDTPSERTET